MHALAANDRDLRSFDLLETQHVVARADAGHRVRV
jgi:hypothetical protein